MLIRCTRLDIPSSEITPRRVYLDRRELLMGAAGVMAGAALLGSARAGSLNSKPSDLSTSGEQLTPREDVASYNNFYEFGTDKSDPADNAGSLTTSIIMNASDWERIAKPRRFTFAKSSTPAKRAELRLRFSQVSSPVISGPSGRAARSPS